MRVVFPLWTWVFRERTDGQTDEYSQLWPLYHRQRTHDGRAEWNALSPLPLRAGNMYGVSEAYGWIWTLARGITRTNDDSAVELAANLYTARTRGDTVQRSVPFLFNYEADSNGAVLRLFQVIPIPLGAASETEDDR